MVLNNGNLCLVNHLKLFCTRTTSTASDNKCQNLNWLFLLFGCLKPGTLKTTHKPEKPFSQKVRDKDLKSKIFFRYVYRFSNPDGQAVMWWAYVICPCALVGIGLNELHNSGWTKGYSAHPQVASLLFKGLALIMLVTGSTNTISVKYMD